MSAGFQRDYGHQNVVAYLQMEAKCLMNDPVAETEWLHRIAEANGLPNAIIGQALFCQGDIDAMLVDHAAYPLIRSIR